MANAEQDSSIRVNATVSKAYRQLFTEMASLPQRQRSLRLCQLASIGLLLENQMAVGNISTLPPAPVPQVIPATEVTSTEVLVAPIEAPTPRRRRPGGGPMALTD